MKRLFFFTLLFPIVLWAAEDAALQDSIPELVVTGSRGQADVRYLPLTVSTIGREALEQSHQTNMLPTLTEQVPGLFVTSRGVMGYAVSTNAAGSISVRGLSGGAGQMMVLIDGHPQYQGVFGHSIADSYQNMLIDHVEVIRGPASMLYGSNAMGGVVNIVTRQLKQDTLDNRLQQHTDISLSAGSYATIEAEVSNSLRKGRFSSTIAAQYNRTDNHRANMGFEQAGGFVRLGYDFNDHWRGYADASITYFDAENPGTVAEPLLEGKQWITRGVAEIAVENHYAKTSGAISVYDNFGFHKINDGYHEGEAPQTSFFRSEDHLIGVSAYQTANLFRGNRTTFGLDYQHIYGDAFYTSIATGERLPKTPAAATSHRNEVAGYIDFRQDIVSWLTLDAGIRLDWHSVAGLEWIPQAGLAFRPLNNATLKATVSKGFRNPTMRELYLYKPANDSLRAERMWNYELSWQQHFMFNAQSRLDYGLNIFYLNGDNMIQTQMVDGKPRNMNTGKVENAGAEAELRYTVNAHWALTTNHSYLWMRYPVLAAPQYKGYLAGQMHYGKWHAELGLQYIWGLYTDLTAGTKEDFWLLHASVSFLPVRQVELYLRGDNLLAQKYEINAGFPMPTATVKGGIKIRL